MKNDIFKDIKQCPFCGSRVEISHASYFDGVFGSLGIGCPVCGTFAITTEGKISKSEPRLDAYFDVWQNRAGDKDDHK